MGGCGCFLERGTVQCVYTGEAPVILGGLARSAATHGQVAHATFFKGRELRQARANCL